MRDVITSHLINVSRKMKKGMISWVVLILWMTVKHHTKTSTENLIMGQINKDKKPAKNIKSTIRYIQLRCNIKTSATGTKQA